MKKVIDTLFGSGLKSTIKGALEGGAFAAAIPLLDFDLSQPAGRLAAMIAGWRVLYGAARK